MLRPALVAGALAGVTAAVLRRMQHQYAERDTLTGGTVAAMYATYGAHAAALGWAAVGRVGPVRLPRRAARAVGAVLAAGGAAAAVAGARPFGVGRQLSGIDPGALHTAGVYRYSRNPQYLGLGLAATGVALAARSAFAALLSGGVWWTYRRWIPHEEHHLARLFGQEYLTYRANTARWLGTPARPGAPDSTP
ncbi:hypothetical protein BJF79_45385 [Actinomadura sp. CNU-125]|nr:hypothetical protein BJF79_45385 [Actinomadura sp. CNU-125]